MWVECWLLQKAVMTFWKHLAISDPQGNLNSFPAVIHGTTLGKILKTCTSVISCLILQILLLSCWECEVKNHNDINKLTSLRWTIPFTPGDNFLFTNWYCPSRNYFKLSSVYTLYTGFPFGCIRKQMKTSLLNTNWFKWYILLNSTPVFETSLHQNRKIPWVWWGENYLWEGMPLNHVSHDLVSQCYMPSIMTIMTIKRKIATLLTGRREISLNLQTPNNRRAIWRASFGAADPRHSLTRWAESK